MAIDLTKEELKLFTKGDRSTIEKVARSFKEELQSFAKEIVNDETAAFTIMNAAIEKLNSNYEKLDTNEYIGRFLYHVTKNLSINWIRDNSDKVLAGSIQYENLPESVFPEGSNLDEDLAKKIENRLYRDFLIAAIATLSGTHQQVARLYYLEEHRVEAISEELDIKRKAVNDHLDYAIKRIQKFSKKEGQKFLIHLTGRRFL